MIWLIDYTHYRKPIDPRLAQCKTDYFRLKSYLRARIIGPTAPVSSRVFSTGLLRLATILAANGVPVRYMHYYMLEQALDSGEQLPQTVAFSAVCPTVPLCARLAGRIKQRSPETCVMIGGPHVNLNPELTARTFPIFDKMAVGYEKQAAELIAGRELAEPDGDYVDYSLLPYPLREYAINTFTTMGCPFSCAYCADGRAPHYKASPDGQLRQMKKLLPERTLVHFFDSVLGFSPEGIRSVCHELREAQHNFLLSCDMRADLLTPELVRELESAGFVEIRLGMESADAELLSASNRTLMPDRFTQQVRMVRECSNLYITLYSITGLPGTTAESQEKTLDFCDYLLTEHLVDEIKNALYVPYPMSGVDYAERGITLLNENWEDYDRQSFPVFCTELMSAEQLWELYIHTAQSINRSWLRASGFERFEDIPVLEGYYNEYVEASYLDKKQGGVSDV